MKANFYIKRLWCGALILCLSWSASFAQEFYSYSIHGTNSFQLSHKQVLLKFDAHVLSATKAQVLGERITQPFDIVEIPAPHSTMIVFEDELGREELSSLVEQLAALEEVQYANHFLLHEGVPHGITDQLIVKPKNGTSRLALQKMVRGLGVTITGENEFKKGVYHLRVMPGNTLNALEIANQLHESGQFDFAEPDFLKLLEKSYVTNDQFLLWQWGLENGSPAPFMLQGTADADIDASSAWDSTKGDTNIIIAILDEGVDTNHVDLKPNLIGGYDATGQNSKGMANNWDGHGTACAGIAAAVGDNGIGVAGVAYQCKILPVRIAYTVSPNNPNWITTNTMIANGISHAGQNAHVLSNSWTGGAPSSLVTNAILGAVNNGITGQGSPTLFSAGNSNSSTIPYPSSLPEVICVGATSMCDQRKSPTSCDGEFWWGSNYGTGLDVMAPGVEIYTTDITGPGGYTPTDFNAAFNGTSAACPFAAGTMALILSIRPFSSEPQARFILESTCDKIGGVTYTANNCGQPNDTWNNQFGYGRINAHQAVITAGQLLNAPGNLRDTLTTATTTTLKWDAVPGATGYNVRHRAIGTYTWTNYTNLTATSLNLTGLSPSTGYAFEVQTICPIGGGPFVISHFYRTKTNNFGCGTDPTEGTFFPPQLFSGIPNFGLVCGQWDTDAWRIVDSTGGDTLTVVLDQLPADYDLQLWGPNGLIGTSANAGTTAETLVVNNSSAGLYTAFVSSPLGFFNTTLYYRITFTSAQNPPPGPKRGFGETADAPPLFIEPLEAYPNPTQDQVTLYFGLSKEESFELTVTDLQGRLVRHASLNGSPGSNNHQLDLSDATPGVYFLNLTSAEGTVRKKLVLAR